MAINPKIKQKAEDIRNKIFGAEVRESLASGLEGMSEDVESIKGRQGNVENQFQDVLDETTDKDVISAPELIAARNGKSNLKTRLDDEHAQVTAQLQQKATKEELQQVSLAYKESYDTLALLENAYPTGDIYNHTVKSDGMIYTYKNGWISTGIQANGTGIANGSITPEKLSFIPVKGVLGKNKFDKSKVIAGKYYDYLTGELMDNPTYFASELTPIVANTTYTKSTTVQVAFFDVNKIYISGVNTDTTFTTPSNGYYIGMAFRDITEVNDGMLVEGTTLPPYEPYKVMVTEDLLPPSIIKQTYSNLIVVSKENTDLDTINKALSIANDSASNPVTILVTPGVYDESVKLLGRYITLMGTNKETCIIKTFTNDYHNPPVDLAPNSHLYNLTIIADDDGVTTPQDDGVTGKSAYAVHFDTAGRFTATNPLYQGKTRIKNCILESKHYQALGSGLSINQTLIIEDTEFIAHGNNRAFRIHNYLPAGGTGSKGFFKNCLMHNDGTVEPIFVQEVNHAGSGGFDNYDTELTFIHCVAYNETNGLANGLYTNWTPQAEGTIVGHIKLGKASFGNSVPALNA